MAMMPIRYNLMRRVAWILLGFDLTVALVGIVFGIVVWAGGDRALGVLLLGGSFITLLVGVFLYCMLVLTLKFVSNSYRAYDGVLDALELLRRQVDHGHTVAENSALSDAAKRIVFRDKDYEFLRDTIHGAIVRQDWESAEHLIGELETQFGYREEGGRLRAEIARARQATQEEKIAAAIERFEMLCAAQKWEQARRECARLATLFPAHDRIRNLPAELAARQAEYKRHLLKEYDRAAAAQEVDRAHKILVELDRYLAPNEAAALKDSARGVFKARLMQMGVAFSLAVDNKQFPTAIDLGQRLMREFPNSRYAHEIAGMLPLLRQRAAQEGRRDVAVAAS